MTTREEHPAGPVYPCAVVTAIEGKPDISIQIIGAALLRPGRYQLTREEDHDENQYAR